MPAKNYIKQRPRFQPMKARFFSYFVENWPFFGDAGIEIVETFTYDRRKFLR